MNVIRVILFPKGDEFLLTVDIFGSIGVINCRFVATISHCHNSKAELSQVDHRLLCKFVYFRKSVSFNNPCHLIFVKAMLLCVVKNGFYTKKMHVRNIKTILNYLLYVKYYHNCKRVNV